MDRAAVDRMNLDAVDEDRTGRLPVHRQVDECVLAGLPAELVELVRIDRDVLGADPMPVHDRRQATTAAEDGDLLADERARLADGLRSGRPECGTPYHGGASELPGT